MTTFEEHVKNPAVYWAIHRWQNNSGRLVEGQKVEIMATAENYAMVRSKRGAVPRVVLLNELYPLLPGNNTAQQYEVAMTTVGHNPHILEPCPGPSKAAEAAGESNDKP